MSPLPTSPLICRLCGQIHRSVDLAPGSVARCVRCQTRLKDASRSSAHDRQPARIFAFAGLAFAVPAAALPFITVEKFGNARSGDFMTGVSSLLAYEMPLVAVWVFLCGALVPTVLLGAFALGRSNSLLPKFDETLAHWAMPEVYVLAVLVALTRLGSLVDVELNAGFWSYAAMSAFLLLASRAQRLGSVAAQST